jgi:hypothetical protein
MSTKAHLTPSELEAAVAPREEDFAPSMEWGIASTCLGSIALMLVILPILSIPFSACGLLAGLGGIVRGVYRGKVGLRWSIIGSALSASVLLIGIMLVNAPVGETPGHVVPHQDWASPDQPNVSPPAVPTS